MVRCLYVPIAFKGLMEVQQQSALNVAMCFKIFIEIIFDFYTGLSHSLGPASAGTCLIFLASL